MSTGSQKFVLVGPRAGKTLTVNGHQFVDGEMTFVGSAAQIATLERVLGFYGVLPAEKAELAQLKADKPVEKSQAELDAEAEAAAKAEEDEAARLAAEEAAKQKAETDPPAKTDAELEAEEAARKQAELDALGSKPSLGEAIGLLDPNEDKHWTSNNLPNLEHLGELIGKKVARAEVDAVAEGYTRAKARAARA